MWQNTRSELLQAAVDQTEVNTRLIRVGRSDAHDRVQAPQKTKHYEDPRALVLIFDAFNVKTLRWKTGALGILLLPRRNLDRRTGYPTSQ